MKLRCIELEKIVVEKERENADISITLDMFNTEVILVIIMGHSFPLYVYIDIFPLSMHLRSSIHLRGMSVYNTPPTH